MTNPFYFRPSHSGWEAAGWGPADRDQRPVDQEHDARGRHRADQDWRPDSQAPRQARQDAQPSLPWWVTLMTVGRLISKHIYLQTRPASPPPHPPRSRWRAPSRHCRSPPRRPGQCHTPRPATRPTLEPCRPCSSPGPSTQPPGVTSDQAVRHWQYLVNRAVWLQPANKWPSPVSYYPLWFVQNKKLLISQKRKSFFWQIIEFLYLKIILVKFLKGWLSCRTSHQKQHWVSWNCANC